MFSLDIKLSYLAYTVSMTDSK